MYKIKRSKSEIDECLNSAIEWEENGGSQFPGMTYEQGVIAGIGWVIGDLNDHPVPGLPDPE